MMDKFLTESSLTEIKENAELIEQRIDQNVGHIKTFMDLRE